MKAARHLKAGVSGLIARKLCNVQLVISALFSQELLVVADLHNTSLVHYNYFIRIAYGGETVGDDKARSEEHTSELQSR